MLISLYRGTNRQEEYAYMHPDFREGKVEQDYLVSTAFLELGDETCQKIVADMETKKKRWILEHCKDPERFRERLAKNYGAKVPIDIFIATSKDQIISTEFAIFNSPPGKTFAFKAESDHMIDLNSLEKAYNPFSTEQEVIAITKEPIFEVRYE